MEATKPGSRPAEDEEHKEPGRNMHYDLLLKELQAKYPHILQGESNFGTSKEISQTDPLGLLADLKKISDPRREPDILPSKN